MAKSRSQGKAAKSARSSRKAANALGYAKRQTLKSKTLAPEDVADVYEYQQEKVRRAKVKLQLEKDEILGAGGSGSGSEDEAEGGSRRRRDTRPRLVGENDDDDRIEEDEDEEIDSDEAFEESDEERFAGFSFSHKSKAKSKSKLKKKTASGRAIRFAEVDLNEDGEDARSDVDDEEASEGSVNEDDEDDEEEEEGDPNDFIDVLDVLDGRGKLQNDDDQGETQREADVQRREPIRSDISGDDEEMGSEKEDSDDDEEEEEDDDQIVSASESEEEREDDSALQELEGFVTGLDVGQKRKAPDDADGKDDEETKRARKRRLLPERTEAGVENEFAPASGAGKLNLDDLLAPLEGQSSNLLSLKKSAKVLASNSGKVKTLSAPLPQRTAEKLDREAAYEQTKEEVDKWKATMQRIKEAEHLSFPLQAEPQSRTSNLELAAKFKPTTELESAVDKLLKSAKMRENEIAQTESLKMNHLSVEEVAARRAELAKMRDLMFRAEAKAKRIAKIKSKTYRRIKKKERARLAAKLGEGEDEDLEDEEARLKREIERARERATLRHKNTGKWAKAMRARGELDEDQRRDINEMLDRGEKLRRKISGEGESGDEDSDDETDDDDGEGGIERIKAKAFDELAALNADEPEAPAGQKGKSIFDMKFMKDAMAREQRKANEMVDDFIKEMGGADPDAEQDETEPQDVDGPSGTIVQRTGGRVVYRPGALNTGVRPAGSLASDTSSVTLKSTDLPPEVRDTPVEQSASPPGSPASRRPIPPPPAEDVNPWLAQASEASKPVQAKHEVAISKESGAAEKSKNKLRKRVQKRLEEKEKAQEDATVDISLSTVMTLGEAGPSKTGQTSKAASEPTSAGKGKAGANQDEDDSDSDVNSEVEEQEKALAQKGKGKAKANGVKAFEQRDLVALAFAGDNVVQDFAEAKRREMQEDAPKEVDTTLPGWGSWGGLGTKKAPPKPHLVKKLAGVDPATRADYKKAHVIISEKRDKKAAKYLVKDLPYPYTSKAQFERSMEMPLGTEWNTRLGFQRATLPKVVTKMGTLITPLEKHT